MDYGWILKAKTWIPDKQTDIQETLPMSPQIRCLSLGVTLKTGQMFAQRLTVYNIVYNQLLG